MAALALVLASAAQAAPVTVGQVFVPTSVCSSLTILQKGVASGTSYVAPISGVITSWSVEFGSTTIPGLKLKVGRSAGGSNYTIVGESTVSAETMNTVDTYPANIPVQAGDVIGLYNPAALSPCALSTGSASDAIETFSGGEATVGSTDAFAPGTMAKVDFSATITPPPGVSAITPSSGGAGGGTAVTITGNDLTGATAVKFGSTSASSFKVNSDTSITAVAPAGSVGAVDVTVTTPGGQSPASAVDQFTYLPPPGVTLISPTQGPRTGGTSVTIAGEHFVGATAVSFGGEPATSFTVGSDTTITAVAPASAAGTVDVTVTSPNGTSAAGAGDHFTFLQICVVPKLKGKTLKAAKKALRTSHCGVGKVAGPTTGKVKHQSKRPGTTLPGGTRVSLKLA